jgi:cell division septal protein FtsQ
MKRRLVVSGAVMALAIALWFLAPLGLSKLSFFQLRQVEVVGLRYLSPELVLAEIGIEADRNVFESLSEIDHRAEGVPGIVNARVVRRLPGTLRLELVEEPPVAFARGQKGLVPLDIDARPLPYDPSVTGFDLPVAERPEPVLTRALATIRGEDPQLFQLVDGARRGQGGMVVLELGEQRVLLREDPLPAEIRAVETVRWHLIQKTEPFSELDARFDGWVVVRRRGA